MKLNDAMRQTLNGYARTLHGQGRADANGMILGLAREHDLERRDAVAAYREWERETLAAHEAREKRVSYYVKGSPGRYVVVKDIPGESDQVAAGPSADYGAMHRQALALDSQRGA